MQEVSPEVHLIAATQLQQGLDDACVSLGIVDYLIEEEDGEELIEFGGRLCYKSFKPGMNPNVKRVRENHRDYLHNILTSKHGSVLEHASVSFLFLNVSRVFTHEVVRHRQGTAFSQESQRYVRIVEVPIWLPPSLTVTALRGKPYDEALSHDRVPNFPKDDGTTAREYISRDEWAQWFREGFIKRLDHICTAYEDLQEWSEVHLALDATDDFHYKKTYTSLIRRGMPQGCATNILITANHRAWRFMIEQRASGAADEEIDMIFVQLAKILEERFPNLYQDMSFDTGRVTFANSKV